MMISSTIEINDFSIGFIDNSHPHASDRIAVLEGVFSLIPISYFIEIKDAKWNKRGSDDPGELSILSALRIVDERWSLNGEIEWLNTPAYDEILDWNDLLDRTRKGVRIQEEGFIKVDDHKWDLIPTLNKVLQIDQAIAENFFQSVMKKMTQISTTYFNSKLLPLLFEQLWFQIRPFGLGKSPGVSLTVSQDRSHFAGSERYPSYIFLKIPTPDLEYYVNHFVRPVINVKGYQLAFVSMEVTDDNVMEINLKEESKSWLIKLKLSMEVRDNEVYMGVNQIDVEGLNALTNVVFKIFKRLLVRQIENRSIPVDLLYDQVINKLEKEAPFLVIMEDQSPVLRSLIFDKKSTEFLIYFSDTSSAEHA